MWARFVFHSSIVLGGVLVAVFAVLVIGIMKERAKDLEAAKGKAREHARDLGRAIDADLRELMAVAHAVGEEFRSGALKRAGFEGRLRKALNSSPNLFEAGVAFAPFAYDAAIRLHGIACIAEPGGVEAVELDAIHDYANGRTDWYERPLAEGPVWLEPAYHEEGDAMVARYAIPLRDGSAGQPVGVVYADYLLKHLATRIHALDLGQAGYSMLLSPEGRFIHHPHEDYVGSPTTVFEVAAESGNEALAAVARDAVAGKPVLEQVYGDLIQRWTWACFEPVPSAGWAMGIVLVHDDVHRDAAGLRHRLMRAGVILFLACFLLSAPVFRVHCGRRNCLWRYAMFTSLLCLFLTVWVIFLVVRIPEGDGHDPGRRITGHADLNGHIAGHKREALKQRGELPVYIPTGIYVQSCTFISANDVRVTGYVWQKYTKGVHELPDGVGVLMPESESAEFEKAYREEDEETVRIAWKFRVVLHQEFDYSKYPFARENVWVQLWHEDFIGNVILVPDLDAYKMTNPSLRPGLLEGLELSGWRIEETFFSYREYTYQTDFGIGDYSGLTDFPELHYNMIIRKGIIGPFVSHILPLAIVFLLLFTILLLSTQQEKKMGLFGFNTLSVVAACAGFFLVVIFSHIDLRSTLGANTIIYLENYYFLVYTAILLVAINSLLYTRTRFRWIQFEENFIPRILYWPANMACILAFTLVTYYR